MPSNFAMIGAIDIAKELKQGREILSQWRISKKLSSEILAQWKIRAKEWNSKNASPKTEEDRENAT